jgi:hypothetical protein
LFHALRSEVVRTPGTVDGKDLPILEQKKELLRMLTRFRSGLKDGKLLKDESEISIHFDYPVIINHSFRFLRGYRYYI